MVVTFLHSFRPKPGSTQCGIHGCWGWVDDPRHATLLRGHTPADAKPRPAPQPYTTPGGKRHKTDWSRYDACPLSRCKVRAGWPCRRLHRSRFAETTVKTRPHDRRPVLKVRADA